MDVEINESLATDESIEEYEYHEYEPITGSNLNNPGEIRITVQTQSIFYHPSESYLLFEGQLTKKDGTAYANDKVVISSINYRDKRLNRYITLDKRLLCWVS